MDEGNDQLNESPSEEKNQEQPSASDVDSATQPKSLTVAEDMVAIEDTTVADESEKIQTDESITAS